MAENNELQLWLALENLTKIDNEAALFQESITLLSILFPGVELIFYKVHVKRNEHHQRDNHSVHKPVIISLSNYFDKKVERTSLHGDSHMETCYYENKTVSYKPSGETNTVYVFPFSYEKEIQNLLKVVIPDDHLKSIPHVSHFFNVFINYYKVIRSNERDFLTGMYNRRAFNRVMNSLEIHHHIEHAGKHDYLIIIDIDLFKKINDNYGHMIGDEVLILFSRVLRENIRTMDIAFRTGGEEFVIIARDLTFKGITMIAERIRSMIEKTAFPQVHKLTISAGFTCIEYPLDTFFALKKADAALYFSKEHGRNQVACYETLIEAKVIEPVKHFEEIMDIW